MAAAIAPMGPRQALDLGADADALTGGDNGSDARNQAFPLRVLEERAEELGRAADHRL